MTLHLPTDVTTTWRQLVDLHQQALDAMVAAVTAVDVDPDMFDPRPMLVEHVETIRGYLAGVGPLESRVAIGRLRDVAKRPELRGSLPGGTWDVFRKILEPAVEALRLEVVALADELDATLPAAAPPQPVKRSARARLSRGEFGQPASHAEMVRILLQVVDEDGALPPRPADAKLVWSIRDIHRDAYRFAMNTTVSWKRRWDDIRTSFLAGYIRDLDAFEYFNCVKAGQVPTLDSWFNRRRK
jgi:hypothetical protein